MKKGVFLFLLMVVLMSLFVACKKEEISSQVSQDNNQLDIPNNESENDSAHVSDELTQEVDETLDELLGEYFEKIYLQVAAGYNRENIKESRSKEYEYIVSQGFEAVDFLKGQLNGADVTARKKIAIEWLISDIIKLQCQEDLSHIREEYWITAVNSDCYGLTGPDHTFDKWCELPKNTVIRITGSLFPGWYTATRVVPMKDEELPDLFMSTDQVEFWINRECLLTTEDNQPLSFEVANLSHASEYMYMITSDIEKEYSARLDREVQQVKIYENPSEESNILGFSFAKDRIMLKRDWDCDGTVIRDGEWVLIEKIPFYWDCSDIGWIKEEYLTEITENSQPAQGFVFGDTKLYSGPREDCIYEEGEKEFLNHVFDSIDIACVHISDEQDGWYYISEFNSFGGWVKKEDVFFIITDEINKQINYPDPDFELFMSHLKEEISNNPSFVLKAEDTGDMIELTPEQKDEFSSALLEISEYKATPGGISDYREAAYPFYRLDFNTYSMVVTTKNQLLIMMEDNDCYDYGIGRRGASIRYITPNIEFIAKIKEMLPTQLNNNEDNPNYLMNATQLTLEEGGYTTDPFIEPEQINKSTRAIIRAMGEEIPKNNVDQNVSNVVKFNFIFDDGRIITITYTDKYIEYNGKYYHSMQQHVELMGGLFAGYF